MMLMMLMMIMMMNKHCLGKSELFAEIPALITQRFSAVSVKNFQLKVAKIKRWKSKRFQPSEKILVNSDHSPKDQGKNEKYLKPPPRKTEKANQPPPTFMGIPPIATDRKK